MDGGLVQRVPGRPAGPGVAHDHGNIVTGPDELLGYDGETFDVLAYRPKDVLLERLRRWLMQTHGEQSRGSSA